MIFNLIFKRHQLSLDRTDNDNADSDKRLGKQLEICKGDSSPNIQENRRDGRNTVVSSNFLVKFVFMKQKYSHILFCYEKKNAFLRAIMIRWAIHHR